MNVVLYLLIPDPALDTILAGMNGLFSVIFLLDFLYRARPAESFGIYFVRGFGWAESRLATRRTGRLAGRVPDRTRRLQQLLAQSQAMVTGLQALLREASDDTGRGSE